MADDEIDAIFGASRRPPPAAAADSPSTSSGDSYLVASDDDSQDSAVQRRRAAERRIRDHIQADAKPPPTALPPPGAAFEEVDGPPAFLDPEATRPLADSLHRRRLQQQRDVAAQEAAARERSTTAQPSTQGKAKEGWDISHMAPQLKGGLRPEEKGVVSGAAVRYSTTDQHGAGVSAAAIAMLGGQGRDAEDDDDADAPAAGPRVGGVGPLRPPAQPETGSKKRPTNAMAVDSFLDKGVGGAQLPRRDQARKEREKNKRARGQSSHSHWKSEAEMVLRQQYD